MFQGMTIGEQRTLLGLVVVIALGLGVQSYRTSQQSDALYVKHPLETATPSPSQTTATPMPSVQAAMIPIATPAAAPTLNAPRSAATATPVNASPSSALIDLNRATQTDLENLPGIGPVRAKAILDFRFQAGGFHRVEDLLEVKGIGEKTLEKLKPLVSVGQS